MQRFKTTLMLAMAGVLAAAIPVTSVAQGYPAKPIKIVVPYAAGGPNDIVVRTLGKKLTEQMGQVVIVDNRAGAGGNIGAEAVAKSPPDGYTLLLVTTGHSINPSLYPNLSYDLRKDFVPIAQLTSGPMLVVVNPSLPVKNLQDLIALAKSKPGSLTFASAGNGSSTHLAPELFSTMAGIKMVHVPYKGSAPALTDVMAGHAQVAFDLAISAMPHVKSGKLKALAVTSAKRSPAAPDLPTVAESGLPGFEVIVWNGLMAPAGTPKEIIAKLNVELKKALDAPDVKEAFAAQGYTADWSTAEAFNARVNSEIDKWSKVVKASGAKID